MTDGLDAIAGWVGLRALEGGVDKPKGRTAGGSGCKDDKSENASAVVAMQRRVGGMAIWLIGLAGKKKGVHALGDLLENNYENKLFESKTREKIRVLLEK